MAGLLKYFHHESKQKLQVLPDPKGSTILLIPAMFQQITKINFLCSLVDLILRWHGSLPMMLIIYS